MDQPLNYTTRNGRIHIGESTYHEGMFIGTDRKTGKFWNWHSTRLRVLNNYPPDNQKS